MLNGPVSEILLGSLILPLAMKMPFASFTRRISPTMGDGMKSQAEVAVLRTGHYSER
ncbi:MAG: hypothetical protein AAB669_02390 [Patescibacteria group bacterium]